MGSHFVLGGWYHAVSDFNERRNAMTSDDEQDHPTGVTSSEWCDFLADHPELGVSASERLGVYVADLVEHSRHVLAERGDDDA
jgi:hypothetical protein